MMRNLCIFIHFVEWDFSLEGVGHFVFKRADGRLISKSYFLLASLGGI
jgi:hypothetical protein